MRKQIQFATYARVSSRDQNPQLQFDALKRYFKALGVKPTFEFIEQVSGAGKRRPEREKLLALCVQRKVDCVVVWKLDRWGRSVLDLIQTLTELGELDVNFISITEAIDSSTTTGRLMRNVMAAFAEFERELIKERALAGMDAYREKGGKWGRPATGQAKSEEVFELSKAGWSNYKIGAKLGIHRSTVGRILKTATSDNERET